jgi:hypothetical protein
MAIQIGDVIKASDITTALNGKSNTGHTHDDRYYTESELSAQLPNTAISLPANANLNNYITPGYYYTPSNATAQTMTNTPWGSGTSTSAASFSMEVVRHAGVSQILRAFNISGYEYQRQYYYETNWGSWVRMARMSDTMTPATHTHDDRYYTESEVDTKILEALNYNVYKNTNNLTNIKFISSNVYLNIILEERVRRSDDDDILIIPVVIKTTKSNNNIVVLSIPRNGVNNTWWGLLYNYPYIATTAVRGSGDNNDNINSYVFNISSYLSYASDITMTAVKSKTWTELENQGSASFSLVGGYFDRIKVKSSQTLRLDSSGNMYLNDVLWL